jgi:hypothetical protein
MRIAISGTSNIGKQQFKKALLKAFPQYKTPETNYKDVIEAIYQKSQEEDRETSAADIQWNILNYMIDTFQKYDRDEKVIFDGCTLDNILYSLYILEKAPDVGKIDGKFIDNCVPIVRESMKYLDIVFMLPITKADETDRKFTEEDKEINNLYNAFHKQYLQGASPFLPKDDQPAIIEVFGNETQRLQMVKLYLDESGEVINDKSIGDLIDPGMMDLVESTEQMVESDNKKKKTKQPNK